MTWSIHYWRNKETQHPGSTKSSKTKQLHKLSVCPKLTLAHFPPPRNRTQWHQRTYGITWSSTDMTVYLLHTKSTLWPHSHPTMISHTPASLSAVTRKLWGSEEGDGAPKTDSDPLSALHVHVNSHSWQKAIQWRSAMTLWSRRDKHVLWFAGRVFLQEECETSVNYNL